MREETSSLFGSQGDHFLLLALQRLSLPLADPAQNGFRVFSIPSRRQAALPEAA